jgi:hypothetical protein
MLAVCCWGGFDPVTALPDDIARRQAMNTGKTLFAQLTDFLPWTTFDWIVARYNGNRAVRTLPCAAQYQVMAFAQITYRESLRDIEACLSAQSAKLYHMGLPGPIRPSTLTNANETRDWRIYAEFAQRLIAQTQRLYAGDDLDVDLTSTIYALDSTTVNLCLSVFPWAHFRSTKAAVKMHTLLEALLQGLGAGSVRVGSERWGAEEGRRWVGAGCSKGGSLCRGHTVGGSLVLYLQFPISYHDLELMLQDRGVSVDHTTIFRWIQAYSAELGKAAPTTSAAEQPLLGRGRNLREDKGPLDLLVSSGRQPRPNHRFPALSQA